MWEESEEISRLRALWDSVQIVRPVEYTLFTFGDSCLSYYLVTSGNNADRMVRIRRGDVRVSRPLIISPHDDSPEFQNFFDELELDPEERAIHYLISRSAAFSNLRFSNESGPAKIVSDQMEEAIAKLQRQLDQEDEDRIAILTAPSQLARLAVMKYTIDRVMQSTPGNIQELREKGRLPGFDV